MKQRWIVVGDHALNRTNGDFALEMRAARTCSEARLLLGEAPAPSQVVTDVSLPDGNWCDILRMAVYLDVPVEVQVLEQTWTPTFQREVEARGGRCVRTFEPAREQRLSAPDARSANEAGGETA